MKILWFDYSGDFIQGCGVGMATAFIIGCIGSIDINAVGLTGLLFTVVGYVVKIKELEKVDE